MFLSKNTLHAVHSHTHLSMGGIFWYRNVAHSTQLMCTQSWNWRSFVTLRLAPGKCLCLERNLFRPSTREENACGVTLSVRPSWHLKELLGFPRRQLNAYLLQVYYMLHIQTSQMPIAHICTQPGNFLGSCCSHLRLQCCSKTRNVASKNDRAKRLKIHHKILLLWCGWHSSFATAFHPLAKEKPQKKENFSSNEVGAWKTELARRSREESCTRRHCGFALRAKL